MPPFKNSSHTHTHARTHARTHAHTHISSCVLGLYFRERNGDGNDDKQVNVIMGLRDGVGDFDVYMQGGIEYELTLQMAVMKMFLLAALILPPAVTGLACKRSYMYITFHSMFDVTA